MKMKTKTRTKPRKGEMMTFKNREDIKGAILGGLFALLICTMFARLEWKQRLFEQKEKARQERIERKQGPTVTPVKSSLNTYNHAIN